MRVFLMLILMLAALLYGLKTAGAVRSLRRELTAPEKGMEARLAAAERELERLREELAALSEGGGDGLEPLFQKGMEAIMAYGLRDAYGGGRGEVG